jgi:hypothetical protein
MNSYALNETIRIEAIFRDISKNPITTADGRVTIRRHSDDLYFNGSAWQAAPFDLVMTKLGHVNHPGIWEYNFNTNTMDADVYTMSATDNNALAKNVPQVGESSVGSKLAEATERGAAGAIGKVVYNELTSELTLYAWDDDTKVVKVFNCKDSQGNASGKGVIYEKLPI